MSTETTIVIAVALGIAAAGYILHQNAIAQAKQKTAEQWSTVAQIGTFLLGL